MAHAASPDARGWRPPAARRASARAAQAGRGREAESPSQIPAPGWRDIAIRVKDDIKNDRLSIVAAGVAFYAALAFFPAIAALISLYGLFLDPQRIAGQLSAFGAILPQQALELLEGQLREIASARSSALSLAAVGALLLTLWSASGGIKTLMEALNVAYKEQEQRGFFKLNAVALLLTLGGIVGAVIALAIVIALPAVVAMMPLGEMFANVVLFARWPLLAVAMMVALGVLYRFGPSRQHPRWSWVSWGAVIATIIWLVASGLFSYYVAHFGDYNKTYGSVAAVVILLTWFLLTAYAVLIGAEINAEMERQTRKDTTDGPARPLGRRGANAADTVGHTP
jgi:membrane protein